MTNHPPLTQDLCRDMLAHLSPNCTRLEWFEIAAALNDALGEAGESLFVEWSERGDKAKPGEPARVYRSAAKPGKVTAGTLVHRALAAGFRFPKDGDAAARPPAPTPAELQAAAQAKAERIAREQAAQAERHGRAAAEAARLLGEATEAGADAAGYSMRKGIKGYGVRVNASGDVLVPLRTADGKLWNVQSIAPAKPAGGAAGKLFLKGGRKSGLMHWCGDPESAAVLLICEGYATAASIHEATGRPVAVAFDAGNLAPVVRALRGRYPATRIVVCGDDDRATAIRTGRNPGREKANEAAKVARGLAVFPEGLSDGASDWNDLHQAAGLDAVRSQIEAAIEAAQEAQPGEAAQTPADARKNAPGGRGRAARGTADDGPEDRIDEAGPDAFDPFTVAASGVYFHGFNAQGKRLPPLRICSRLEVSAKTRFQGGGGWGYLLTFADDEGRPQEWPLPRDALQGDGATYRARLAHMGLDIETSRGAREKLGQYIRSRDVQTYATAVDRAGWHGRVFVLPGRQIGEAAERFVIQSEGAQEHPIASRGTVAQWREHVARLAVGNTRLAFAVACAFAATLVRLAEIQTGGFLLKGPSSRGKTSALWAAGSVLGSHAMRHTWDSTKVGAEVLAAMMSDLLLILDELKQADPRDVGAMVYLLGNSTGRNRGNASMKLRPILTWKLLFLAGGELTLEEHMRAAGLRPAEGQSVRMVTIPAEPDGIVGSMWETTHGFADGKAFAEHLERATARYHGAAGLAFIEWTAAHFGEVRQRLGVAIEAFARGCVPPGADGQVHRVATRFGLVAAGGELATEAGLTGWPQGEATRAALACFKSWLAHRPGGAGSGETAAILAQVRRWFALNGAGRFTYWHRALDDRSPDKGLRAGFKQLVTADGRPIKKDGEHLAEFGERMSEADAETTAVDFYVFAEVFDAEVCEGADPATVKRLLLERGHLVRDKGTRGYTFSARLPGFGGRNVKCYRIKASILEGDGEGAE
jgi:putative DNA primase/helicase